MDWELFEGDCLERMRAQPDRSVDAIITDPPFGTTNAEWDVAATGEAWWREALRITYEHSAIVLFACGQYTADLLAARRALFRYKWVWKRGERSTGAMDANRRPLRIHEDVLVFGRRLPAYEPVMRRGPMALNTPLGLSQLYGDKSGKGDRSYFTNQRHPTDVVDIATDDRRSREHPTQKPVELMSLLVRSYVPVGGVVLDPFAGSGSTGAAAALWGRRAILCEKDAGFCGAIRRRMAALTPIDRDSDAPPSVDEVLGGRLF